MVSGTAARRELAEARVYTQAAASLAAALVLGLGAVLVSRGGAGERPALAIVALLAGAVAAVLPLRLGLPVAVALATFNGLLADLGASYAAYWNELFVAALVVRSLAARRPTAWEGAAAAAVAAVYLGHLIAGAPADAVFWGAKVLLTSLVALWALARLGPDRRAWTATCWGLAIAAGANVVLAVWQHHAGAARLAELGIHRGRLETTAHGVRVFGGFESPAAFSLALTLALFVWIAWALAGSRGRREALATAWVAPACVLGLVWAEHRTTLVALAVAVATVTLRSLRGRRLAVAALALAGLAAGLVLVVGGSGHGSEARFRVGIWRAYLDELSAGGAGPAASGAAYRRAYEPAPRPLPLAYGVGRWGREYTWTGVPYRWYATPGVLVVRPPAAERPVTVVTAAVRSYVVARQLSVWSEGTTLASLRVPAERFVRLRVRVPPGRGPARLELGSRPGPQATHGELGTIDGPVAVQLRAVHVDGFARAPTPAQRVYERRLDPAAPPGVVDNQYVSWLFDYGVLGFALCLAWAAIFLAPLVVPLPFKPFALAARLAGVLIVVAALGVNAWEEVPTDLLAAAIVAPALATMAGARRRKPQ